MLKAHLTSISHVRHSVYHDISVLYYYQSIRTDVTDKIIAMGFPSEGAESVYRNKLADVQRYTTNGILAH